ncbi:hypothetical protein SAMN02745823_02597 [Sporobacter termitidis DSM 10068]|uniref:HD domain-containing protein n=1 Tax=Sporobacter termitidis DSM 10068 TaxID=1123282 RepID=A0A1M5YKN1_9FIRM|nr:phosphohydrolase [Sporobacter termitidis]SHI12605.1 hypothetical protein SAMN02745823_02597 [Sporobacter termitidis DSM 10068]
MEPMAKNPNHILTYANISFDPTAPRPEDIVLEDIAHALSMMTRANGHFRTFYSVAQHSLNCSREAEHRGLSDRIRLACLLHDASEAYLSDITRPVKHRLPGYVDYERTLQGLIYEKFGPAAMTPEELAHLKAIDDALMHHEFKRLHGSAIYQDEPELRSDPDFSEKPHAAVEKEFLFLLKQLTGNAAPE